MTHVARCVSLFFLLLVGCASSLPVTRVVGGRRVDGRFVAEEAYASYMKGVVLEQQGHFDAAMAAYSDAIAHDPRSAELWTRLGVLRCSAATGASRDAAPWAAFDRAGEIDAAYEETWSERARCHLKRGDLVEAARAARMAISLDPDRTETAILLALVLERQGQNDEARRWLEGLAVRDPLSITAHEALLAFAARTHDDERRRSESATLARLHHYETSPEPRASPADVDAEILRGNFDRARRLALAARLSSGMLAVRAAALGRVSFAKAQAELVLAADPADGDAWTAAAVAADLARDDDALGRALSNLPSNDRPLSLVSTLLMAELLGRRIGPQARSAWLGVARSPAAGDADDPLARELEKRR